MSENCSIISAPLLAAFIEKYGVEEGVRRYQRGEEIEPTKTEVVRQDCLPQDR